MKFIKYLLNSLSFIILLILVIILIFITCTKTMVSKKNMSDFISDSNILNVDINVLFNQEESGITLKQKITSLAITNNIPKEIIDDILKSKQINNLLGDFFNQTINYIINGGSKPQILDETIKDMKLIAGKSLEQHINIMLEEEELNSYIEKYCLNIVDIIPERNQVIGDIDIQILEDILNFNVNYIYIMIIIIVIVINAVNKCWYKFIKYLGFSMLLSGILFVVLGSMEYVVTNFIINNIDIVQSFIISLITNLLTIWFKSGVLVSFSSVVLILIYLTINRMATK